MTSWSSDPLTIIDKVQNQFKMLYVMQNHDILRKQTLG